MGSFPDNNPTSGTTKNTPRAGEPKPIGRTGEHPRYSGAVLMAASSAEVGAAADVKHAQEFADSIEGWSLIGEFGQTMSGNLRGRALDPVAGEIVGSRLAKALDIAAPVDLRVVSGAEAAQLPSDAWVVKVFEGSRLEFWRPQSSPNIHLAIRQGLENIERVLAVRKIHGAISLHALANLHGIASAPCPIDVPALDGKDVH